MDNDDIRIENARINEIGLFYFGHGNCTQTRVELDGRGWGASITIPIEKVGRFVKLFRDEPSIADEIEDGIFINRLKGLPVRVMFDGQSIGSRIIGIGDIMADENAEEDEFLMIEP